MKYHGYPKKQGLYDPDFEHDACGIGFLVNIKGKSTHKTVQQALAILINLTHRGGCGSESNTGDGAGILIQIPHKFILEEGKRINIDIPNEGEYGMGMFFLSHNSHERNFVENGIEKIVIDEGQELLGWRDVPTDDSVLGIIAKKAMPFFRQVFIGKNKNLKSGIEFERKLYVIRKRIENFVTKNNKYFYAASLSSNTIVYKGMLTAQQVSLFYKDLTDKNFETALALIHSRYSTNTFPSWERAHPNRYTVHNGEINTLRGNVNWMNTRQGIIKTDLFGDNLNKIFPIINPDGSDSAIFDNCLEFLSLAGRSMEHSVMMMIPEPWMKDENINEYKKAFYEYHNCLMEPWDGPVSIAFTDGKKIGAVLDRNGLRPSRYYVTKDDMVIMSSEVGVLDIPDENILYKERLRPGKMFLVDTELGKIVEDNELKNLISKKHPYKEWLKEYLVNLDDVENINNIEEPDHDTILLRQKAFGYTYEELMKIIVPMARDSQDPLGSMGYDSPLAVLSNKSQLLYNYFKQLFAQVTNPPIDAIREEIVTSSDILLGSEGNLLEPTPESCRVIRLDGPIIDNYEFAKIKNINLKGFKSAVLPIMFKVDRRQDSLKIAMDKLFADVDKEIENGVNLIILSDRGIDKENAPIPALLAVSGLHHHLILKGTRTKASIILESAEPREVHHFSLLLGYGVSAINPYLVFETIEDLMRQGLIEVADFKTAVKNYIKGATKGVIKVLSKMGISTIQSYQGAQIFEALGLNSEIIDKYFTATASRIGGIGLTTLTKEILMRHELAYDRRNHYETLDSGGYTNWRANDEYHLFNPISIHKLQQACKENNYEMFKEYSDLMNDHTQRYTTLRELMDFQFAKESISIEEVESVDSICTRFKTGAMSYGSISKEAHESIAIAMNRLKAKSNSGEGGEDPARFITYKNGNSCSSAIKQVASGRFGVTSNYLVNSKEIQIKMAQGAKPGEGGQLPGSKVYPWIAKVRGSTPGVSLISPPPHHDIYSIEDLAQLIHDLKNANRNARISVKLVSEVGVGTIAAGVAKGRADVILISGYDGGTGASPRTSIKYAGLPWELGLAETHQTLLLNNLRSRVVIETDGKLLTGRDVVIAALLGAEEYGFATAPLVTLGCVMMRVCNLDTCPVGIATQNPELRNRFKGKPEYVENFMKFIAQEVREIMSKLGFRTITEMIGRSDKLKMSENIYNWKAKEVDLSNILYRPEVSEDTGVTCTINQEHEIENSMDMVELLKTCKNAIEKKEKVYAEFNIRNTNRVVGTIVGSEISKKYGEEGLLEDTIELKFKGSAGQSFGAFIPKGMTMYLEGDANDYIGKGLSGGKLIVYPPEKSTFEPEKNIIIGNVAFYGATSGETYIRGVAGERFCVRNSGVRTVVEGVGDHGCEYMTGGIAVILGDTGKNFAAGMSGGIAYVYHKDNQFERKCNKEMVLLEKLDDTDEINNLKTIIKNHYKYTNSSVASNILNNWDSSLDLFVKVIPKDYKAMLEKIKEVESRGIKGDEALMEAFLNNVDILSPNSKD